MSRKFFGTDGMRGRAGVFPMTADMALKTARATAKALGADNAKPHRKRAIIGKDTRLSGYMLEQAMAAGFESAGMDVVFLGPLPTPAVAMFTRSLRADVGVMISASHNPYEDNGIKLFGADGYKLSDAIELEIENHIAADTPDHAGDAPAADSFGKATRLEDAQGRYIEFLKGTFPRRMTLDGLRIVVDCAHGAAYKIAPQVLAELEADVVPIATTPDGININAGCGATDPAFLRYKVIQYGADIGIALDGDADRLVMVDETGTIIDGDQLMALLAGTMQENGTLRGGGIVSTIMSNLGLERFLAARGLTLARTAVGDRYVMEKMRAGGFNLGGEQSGHIVLSDFATTGDGLLAALQVLAALQQTGDRPSAALRLFDPLPQILQNVRFTPGTGIKPLDDESVREAIEKAETSLANDGRLVIRPSGTEPVIRVMAEGDDLDLIKAIVSDLCAVIEQAAGKT